MKLGWFTIALLMAGCAKDPQPPVAPAGSLDLVLASVIQQRRERVVQTPKSGEAWGGLGQAFHAAELHEQASECYARAMRLSPTAARWRHLAAVLQLQNDSQAALTNFALAAQIADKEGQGAGEPSRLRLAHALVERGRFEEAERQIGQLLQTKAGHAGAQLEKARVLFARREFDAAFKELELCRTDAATARPAFTLLAQIRQVQGDHEEATDYTRQAAAAPSVERPDRYLHEVLALRTDKQTVEDHINRLLNQGRIEEAKAAMGALLKAAPNSPETLLLLARVRYQQHDCAEAENILQRQLGIQPDSLNGLVQLGLALLCQEKWAEAVEPLRKAVNLKPDYAQAHFNLGIAFSRMGKGTDAIESFRAALRCTPGDPVIHVALADELRRAGATQEADHHTKRAAELRRSVN